GVSETTGQKMDAKRSRRAFSIPQYAVYGGTTATTIIENHDAGSARGDELEQLQPLSDQVTREARHARNVAPRPSQTRDQSRLDRERHRGHDDRYARRGLLSSASRVTGAGDDQINPETGELPGDLGIAVLAVFRPPVLQCDVLPGHPAQVSQSLHKCADGR